jgi:ligand-binding SRPBCC domain-containing protein
VEIVVVTLVRASAEQVFDLELDSDVHAASLAASGERATTSTGRAALGPGDEVTFAARHLGRTWRLTSRVTEFERPRRFVDEQVRGPFRRMRHEHVFEQSDPASTRMTDRMSFEAPLGALGAVVARWILAPYLRNLLVRRGTYIRQLAESADQADPSGPTGPR